MNRLGLGVDITRGVSLTSLPSLLFSAAGSRGFFYDFSDYTTQFTDTAGTTPVTGTGQSLALVLDESQGLTPGPELVTNGDFSSATNWTLSAGWAITGGTAVAATTSSSLFGGNFTSVAGRTYRIEFDVVSYTSGTLAITVGANYTGNATLTGAAMAAGRKSVLVVSGSSPTRGVEFYGGSISATIDNISVRELPGNHATQATAGSRPLTTTIGTGFRGIQFDGVDDFLQTAAIDFAGAESLGPELVTNGDFSSGTTGWTPLAATLSVVSGALRITATTSGLGATAYTSIPTVVGRSYKFTATLVADAATGNSFMYAGTAAGSGNLLAGNLGSTLGTYSYVFTATGTTTFISVSSSSAVIAGETLDWDNFSVKEVLIAADKMTVVAGVRKLSDAAIGMVVESSVNAAGGNAFQLRAPGNIGNTYLFGSAGSASQTSTGSGFAAPITSVLTGLGDISGDVATLRVNGVVSATNAGDQGTGNYASNIVYIGRRGGSSLPFNGILTFLCVINRTLTAGELVALEAYANSRTGAY